MLLSVDDDFKSVLELAVAELAISCNSVIYQITLFIWKLELRTTKMRLHPHLEIWGGGTMSCQAKTIIIQYVNLVPCK